MKSLNSELSSDEMSDEELWNQSGLWSSDLTVTCEEEVVSTVWLISVWKILVSGFILGYQMFSMWL